MKFQFQRKPQPGRTRGRTLAALALLLLPVLGGCAVVAVADAVVGVGAAAVSVGASAVKAGVKVVGAAVDAVTPETTAKK